MKEPPRLSDDPDLADLFEVAEAPAPMSPAQRRRLRARVAQVATIPAAAGALVWAKGLAFAATLGALGGLGVVTAERMIWPETSRPAPAAVASGSMPAPVETAEPVDGGDGGARGEVHASPPAAIPLAAAPDTPSLPSGDALERETALLEAARRRLASDPAGALVQLGRHAVEFPSGKLAMEREMLRMDALQRAGRGDEARALAQRLLRAHPKSLYAPRLRQVAEK